MPAGCSLTKKADVSSSPDAARRCAPRYRSWLALRSPARLRERQSKLASARSRRSLRRRWIKRHLALRAAGTAIALCPGRRSVCLSVTRDGSVERSRREMPLRGASRGAPGRAPSDRNECSGPERRRLRIGTGASRAEPTIRFVTGNIGGRAERIGADRRFPQASRSEWRADGVRPARSVRRSAAGRRSPSASTDRIGGFASSPSIRHASHRNGAPLPHRNDCRSA